MKGSLFEQSLTIALISTLLVACGGGGGSTSDSGSSATYNALELNGTWVSNCYFDDGVYTIDQFTFSDSAAEISYRSYNDSTCSGAAVDQDSLEPTYTLGRAVRTTSGHNAVEIDYNIVHQGDTFTVYDLISQSDDTFYYGQPTDTPVRPRDIDMDIVMAKQPWTLETVSEDGNWAQLPQVAMDPNGNAMVIWTQYDGSYYNLMLKVYSAADGQWSSPVRINTTPGNVDYSDVVFDHQGNAMVIWEQDPINSSDSDIWAIRYNATAASWGVAEKIESQIRRSERPIAAVDSEGNVVVVWTQTEFGSNYENIWGNRYDATTERWSAEFSITTGHRSTFGPHIAMDEAGNALVVFAKNVTIYSSVMTSRYDVDTDTWTAPQLLENSDAGGVSLPKVTMDRYGNGFAIWSQSPTFDSRSMVFVRRYDDDSGTWASPEVIDSDVGYSRSPTISFDNEGNALALWVQKGASGSNVWSNYYNATTDSWGQEVMLENNTNISDSVIRFPTVSFYDNGDAIAVWKQGVPQNHEFWQNQFDASTGSWAGPEFIESSKEYNELGVQVASAAKGQAILAWYQRNGVTSNSRVRVKFYEGL